MHPRLCIALPLLLAGCLDDDGGSDDGPPTILTHSVICGQDAVEVVVETDSANTFGVEVEVGDSSGPLELHSLWYDGPDRRADSHVWWIDLVPVSGQGEDDTSTVYDCTVGTYALRIWAYDEDGLASDCKIDDIADVGAFQDGCY